MLPSDASFCARCGAPTGSDASLASADPLRQALADALGPQFAVARLLGRGGMGAVYLARELALDRAVAVKVLPPEASDDKSRERFRREARTAARLTHPNIVPLHAFGEAQGMLYFVMGYVRGESLGDRMKRERKLPPDEVRTIVAQLADALAYAHRQGVVHRDIKPDNILIDDESGAAMLTDFGVARAQAGDGTLTEAGVALGTPHYMSPEQAAGDKGIDGRSDLYSLGVVTYYLLTGTLPFDGETVRDVVVQHLTKDPIPLGQVDPAIPADLVDVVGQCLAKEPDDRWKDAAALRASLRGGEESAGRLPEDIAPFESLFSSRGTVYGLLGGYATLISQLWNIPFEGGIPWLFFAVALVSAGVLTWREARRVMAPKGWSAQDTLAVLLREPRWWISWYPKRLRRPNSMWHRLPKRFRLLRNVMGASMGAAVVLAYPFMLAASADPARWYESALITAAFAGAAVPLFASLVPLIVLQVRLRRLGFTHEEITPLFGAEMHKMAPDFWQRPHVAAVLLPASDAEDDGAGDAVEGAVRAIVAAARELPNAFAKLSDEAAAAARGLAQRIRALDDELAMLGQDIDRDESARLERKLAALEAAESDTDAGQGTERHRMRRLLAEQLDLHRRLETRHADVVRQREHLCDLLKALRLHTANLRATCAREDVAVDDRSDEIRGLCEDIARHVSASEGV